MDTSIKYSFLLFFVHTTLAADICLMLSPAEEAALDQAQEHAKQTTYSGKDSKGLIRLDGIIYKDIQSWTIWLNGRPIKAGQIGHSYHILKVTSEFVDLILTQKKGTPQQIRLRPDEVVEIEQEVPDSNQ